MCYRYALCCDCNKHCKKRSRLFEVPMGWWNVRERPLIRDTDRKCTRDLSSQLLNCATRVEVVLIVERWTCSADGESSSALMDFQVRDFRSAKSAAQLDRLMFFCRAPFPHDFRRCTNKLYSATRQAAVEQKVKRINRNSGRDNYLTGFRSEYVEILK